MGKVKSHCSRGENKFMQTLTIEQVIAATSHEGDGAFSKDWVTTPLGPVVIRHNYHDKPEYKEVLGYTFLINMRRLRLVRMESGLLVLVSGARFHQNGVEDPIILFSEDEGRTWSQPREIPMFGTLVNLGGKGLMIFDGNKMAFSEDAGKTWSNPERFPLLPDGRQSQHHGSVLVEKEKVSAIFLANEQPGSLWRTRSLLRCSHDGGHTWGEPIFLPLEWRTSEGSLIRAKNGALVAAMRTAQPEGYPEFNDHWRRMTTACSMDDGKTWDNVQVHYNGHVHSDFLLLPNGDILMTYAARIGELEGMVYHGIEAVLSHDNGYSWEWERKYILFRWLPDENVHSPVTVYLGDGHLLTMFKYGQFYSWGKLEYDIKYSSYVSGIIWSLD